MSSCFRNFQAFNNVDAIFIFHGDPALAVVADGGKKKKKKLPLETFVLCIYIFFRHSGKRKLIVHLFYQMVALACSNELRWFRFPSRPSGRSRCFFWFVKAVPLCKLPEGGMYGRTTNSKLPLFLFLFSLSPDCARQKSLPGISIWQTRSNQTYWFRSAGHVPPDYSWLFILNGGGKKKFARCRLVCVFAGRSLWRREEPSPAFTLAQMFCAWRHTGSSVSHDCLEQTIRAESDLWQPHSVSHHLCVIPHPSLLPATPASRHIAAFFSSSSSLRLIP